MSQVATIGDCVVDVFEERKRAYPGGNALNVGAYLKLNAGIETSFTGIVGDDEFGAHIVETLRRIGVATPRVRVAHGPSGQALVGLEDGDRVFLASNWGGVQRDLGLRIAPPDQDLLGAAELIHTSVYSGLDHELASLAALAPVSYDFSNAPPIEQIAGVLRHISVAFFSAAHLDDSQRRTYARRALELGARTVVLTAGAQGAIAFEEDKVVPQPITPIEVVDTLGAGDGFIAGFLAARLGGAVLPEAMASGANGGAQACRHEGAFGYPTTVDDAQIRALMAHGRRPL